MIRVVLPAHLKTLARVDGEVQLDVAGQVTQASVLDALERAYPALAGTIRDRAKVNAVLMRGINDREATPLLRFCRDRGYHLRFIEQMPLDAQHGWRRANMVTADGSAVSSGRAPGNGGRSR